MKLWHCITCALVACGAAFGQVVHPLRVELRVDSVLSPYVAEWHSVEATLTNATGQTVRCGIRVVITKGDHILARTRVPLTRLYTIAPGKSLYLRGDELFGTLILAEDHLRQDRSWLPLADTGQLQLCVHVIDSMGVEHYAAPTCCVVRAVGYQLPLPLTPVGNVQLQSTKTLRFVWLPVLPARKGTCYILRCYQLPDTLVLAEAVRVQRAVVERLVCNTHQYWWKKPRLAPGRYAWSVQAVDQQTHRFLASSDGYSQWATFVVVASRLHSRRTHQ